MTLRPRSLAARLGAVAAAAAIAGLGASPAFADHGEEGYPSGGSSGTVDVGTVTLGGSVSFSGVGFDPFEQIRIEVVSRALAGGAPTATEGVVVAAVYRPAAAVVVPAAVVATVQADADGGFSTDVELDGAGEYTLLATGLTSGHTVTASVTVAAAGDGDGTDGGDGDGTDGGALPRTGGEGMGAILWTGLGLTAAGAAALTLAARRRAAAQPSQS